MSCKQWTKYIAYLVLILAFAHSVVLIVYIDFSTLPGVPLRTSRYNHNNSDLSVIAENGTKGSASHGRTSKTSSISTEHSMLNKNESSPNNVTHPSETGTIPTEHSILNKNESSPNNSTHPDITTITIPLMDFNDSIPLMDFNDLGNSKERVLLLVIIGSAPQRSDRRQAIRDTWWRHCTHSQVKCVFATDGLIKDRAKRSLILQERNRYKDLELQPLPSDDTVRFGQRFLISIKWAMAKFDFQYFLKLDDDYFVCLKRLLSELPSRPTSNLVWGHFHCQAGNTWADEAFVVFSRDMIHKFLAQDEKTMLCHPYGDQQFSLWLKNMTKVYFHDPRLHHNPPASYLDKFKNSTNVCDSYIGLHGTYAEKMREFWLNSNDGAKKVPPIANFSTFCRTARFDHRRFGFSVSLSS
ncbi:hypothetical protein OS493_032705 [Desmophyllum pertusum]|uniref:Hexosyltransferase n=1 Tax=Desmophyllum pertusum TaxID=174260 RepID=A0A9W9ZWW9_9CNID|nr:hypothetical protein OS493_032705 [Desmophyllum pertusum]